ncbi:DUF3466 family protein [Vibrio metschnikovii]|uniref:DUF3466 family protein n=1 Tax=Vibrio metschnikovii TaxID=28172 RepID=UPI0033325F3D
MKPISSNMFKLTAISAMILSTTSASAALYQVIEVTPPTTFAFESVYGVAIQPGNVADDKPLGCFADNNCESSFKLAGETRLVATHAGQAIDGLSYREEAPFGIDNGFIYVQDDARDFERYCRSELRYAICETWADIRWNIWKKEINGDQTPNAIAFVEGQATPIDETKNVVVNSLTAKAEPIGITLTPGDVTGSRRNSVKALVANTSINIIDAGLQTRAWKTDGNYTVGSVAHEKTNNQGNFYTSKGAIWDSSGTMTEIPWQTTNPERDNRLAQGSLRDVTVKDGHIYAVGYNTFYDDRNFMQASVSSVKVGESNWITKPVTGATVRENGTGGDQIHSNSLLTSVNKNRIAIGEAKRSRTESGALANRLFVVPDIKDPKASFLNGGIFFAGAGGKAGAINNFNEIVGQIDTEETREAGGKPRRKRGFIYPYGTEAQGSNPERQAIFNNRAWILDDLTNGLAENNQYRIIDATDINDAGVISATALKCSGGYDSSAHNAQCGGGKGSEKTVAVKLVPIAGQTSEDITPRGTEDLVTERNGAGLGVWTLILGGLLWFRRK